MAQIIKHRRGTISSVKALTSNNAELIVASGSINNLVGPFVFVGSPSPADNGTAGAFKPTSKIYQGASAPTISSVTYGSILDGTPFHATNNNTLYILNNDGGGGNQAIDLTGNIEGNTITNVNITNLTGSTAQITSITGSLLGNASTATSASHAILADTASYVQYSNIDNLPNFQALYVNSSGDTMTGDLNVSGNINLQGGGVSGSYFSGSFYGDGSNLTGLVTHLNITGDTGTGTIDLKTEILGINGTPNEIETSMSGNTMTIGLPNQVTIQTGSIANDLDVGGNLFISGNLTVLGSSSQVILSSSVVNINDNIIRLNAFSPYERYGGIEVMDSGSTNLSASFVWDSQEDVWLALDVNGNSKVIIGTTSSSLGSETFLTTNTIPKATTNSTIGNSLLTDNGTTLAYNVNKFTVASSNGATLIAGNVTLSSVGGGDIGSKTSAIVFRNSSNVLGYVTTTETSDVLDSVLGYRTSDGALIFSTVIDGGTF